MQKFLIAVLAGALMGSVALAKDTTPSPSGSTAQEPQTPATTPGAPAATEPSTAQPHSPPPPAAQPQQQPAPTGQAAPQSNSAMAGNPPQAGATPRIAPGSVIPVQLAKSVDAKKAKTGDEVVAKVTQDLKNGNGDVVVPKDTKIVGHVTEAQARNKDQSESELGIAFDHAVMKTGDLQMPMSIQAIIAPPSANPGNGNASGDQGNAAPANSASGMSPTAGRNAGAGAAAPAAPNASTGASTTSGDSGAGATGRPAITGNTQGVIGISDLKLAAATNAAQGSLLSSEKNNVKLESGTMMLLRVNP